MLRVSIHAGPWQQASLFNRLDWLDIGYERLAAVADYKLVLFKVGDGAMPPAYLRGYPRWSAPLWDLVARSIAACLEAHPDPSSRANPIQNKRTKSAFAESMSARIQHFPNGGAGGRHVAHLQIDLQPTIRGTQGVYRTSAMEDLLPEYPEKQFTFRTRFLRPAELVLRACTALLANNADALPKFPSLRIPDIFELEGRDHILLEDVQEPAKSGFIRWLALADIPIPRDEQNPAGPIDAMHFAAFLTQAI